MPLVVVACLAIWLLKTTGNPPRMPSTQTASLAEQINALLPQTQCTKCGYQGCLPYAQAIDQDNAPINRCPPGGDAGIQVLVDLLNRPVLPLDLSCGTHQALRVAVIDEQHCIGCTLCIQACPVDAIVGASKQMHTVIADWCTGCDLCIPPCPVDCIEMVPVQPAREWTKEDAGLARQRYESRQQRLAREQQDTTPSSAGQLDSEHKMSVIEQALARARARRQSP